MQPRSRDFELRVAAGDDGQVSSIIWRIWKSRNTDDIYIAARSIASQIKCAIHASGWCYFGFTSPYADKLRQRGHRLDKGRAWTNWERPAIPENGYSIVAQIWLLPGPLDAAIAPGKPVCLLTPPRQGQATVVYVLLSNVKHLEIPHHTIHLQSCELSSGKYLAVFARKEPFSVEEFKDRHLSLFESAKNHWRFVEGTPDGFNADDKFRILMFNEPKEEENIVKFLDISIDLLSSGVNGVAFQFPGP